MTAPSQLPYDPSNAAGRDVVYIIGNVLGIASMGFGGLGVLLSFLPLIGFLAIPFCVGGGVWGGLGALVLHLGKRGSIRFPLIGMALCGVALVICVIINVLFLGGIAASSASGS